MTANASATAMTPTRDLNRTGDVFGPGAAPMRLPRHVPIVLYVDASWEVGGLVGYVVGVARGLRSRGYRVAAVCHRGEVVGPMRNALRDLGVEVQAVEDGDPSLRGRLRRVRALAGVVRRYKGCVVALMMGYFAGGGMMTLAGALGGAGAVVRADLQPPVPPITGHQKLSLWVRDRFTDRIVVGAAENRVSFVRQMGRTERKIDVVNTGIDLAKFLAPIDPARTRETRAGLGYTADTLVVGTISRLSEERKGIGDFLEMAAQVATATPRARFLVVGDGILRGELEAQAERLGIAGRVTFAGWRTDVPELLASMDIFVMPSLFEGGPTTVLEAMAMGAPVVATRVGMVPEVVGHGRTGLVVGPGAPQEMAAAVGTLLEDDHLRARMGVQARAYAAQHFSIERMVDGYVEVFARAIEQRRTARSLAPTTRPSATSPADS